MKKSFFLLCCIAAVFAFSCATTPEDENKSDIELEQSIEIEENPEGEEDQSEIKSENTVIDENVETEEPLYEEKIEEEVLPELEEDSEPEKSEEEEEIVPIEEEIVLDAPVEENDDNAEELPGENISDTDNTASIVVENDKDGTGEETVSENQKPDEENVSDEKSSDAENESEAESNLDEKNNTDSETIDDLENTEEEESEPEEEVISPSRSMNVNKNQLIDITYPGKGWIYQGCIDDEGNVDVRNRYFVFGGRKLGGEDTLFTLRSRLPGKYLLHFYKNDALSGSFIDDYLEVNVSSVASENQNHVSAPSYSEIVPPKAVINSDLLKQKKLIEEEQGKSEKESENLKEKKSSSVEKKSDEGKKDSVINDSELKTVIQKNDKDGKKSSKEVEVNSAINETSDDTNVQKESTSVEVTKNPSQILKDAQAAYDAKKYEESLHLIDLYLEIAVNKIDEGLFLKALTLEARSKVQNIKEAVKLYDLLIQTYPQSKLWEKANERSIYLKRMYINIR